MFTGIIKHHATVVAYDGSTLVLTSPFQEHEIGESIAVQGVCLTLTSFSNQSLCFDLSEETLLCTTLGLLKPNDVVHLERSMSLQDKLGGHIVTGHVDTTAQIISLSTLKTGTLFRVGVFKKYSEPYLVPKGSVALDGVSLTINDVLEDGSITCMLIPHTLMHTQFQHRQVNDFLNVEFDYIAKIVAHQTRGAYVSL